MAGDCFISTTVRVVAGSRREVSAALSTNARSTHVLRVFSFVLMGNGDRHCLGQDPLKNIFEIRRRVILECPYPAFNLGPGCDPLCLFGGPSFGPRIGRATDPDIFRRRFGLTVHSLLK